MEIIVTAIVFPVIVLLIWDFYKKRDIKKMTIRNIDNLKEQFTRCSDITKSIKEHGDALDFRMLGKLLNMSKIQKSLIEKLSSDVNIKSEKYKELKYLCDLSVDDWNNLIGRYNEEPEAYKIKNVYNGEIKQKINKYIIQFDTIIIKINELLK